jgi:hypothetical protein
LGIGSFERKDKLFSTSSRCLDYLSSFSDLVRSLLVAFKRKFFSVEQGEKLPRVSLRTMDTANVSSFPKEGDDSVEPTIGQDRLA